MLRKPRLEYEGAVYHVMDRGDRKLGVSVQILSKTFVQTFSNGRVMSVTNRDSANNQISSLSLGYDSHGRLQTQTDARRGATVFTYDSQDRVLTTSEPPPGSGGGEFGDDVH